MRAVSSAPLVRKRLMHAHHLNDALFDTDRRLGPRNLTDRFQLALAASRGGRLVSFDRGIALLAARQARPEHLVML